MLCEGVMDGTGVHHVVVHLCKGTKMKQRNVKEFSTNASLVGAMQTVFKV